MLSFSLFRIWEGQRSTKNNTTKKKKKTTAKGRGAGKDFGGGTGQERTTIICESNTTGSETKCPPRDQTASPPPSLACGYYVVWVGHAHVHTHDPPGEVLWALSHQWLQNHPPFATLWWYQGEGRRFLSIHGCNKDFPAVLLALSFYICLFSSFLVFFISVPAFSSPLICLPSCYAFFLRVFWTLKNVFCVHSVVSFLLPCLLSGLLLAFFLWVLCSSYLRFVSSSFLSLYLLIFPCRFFLLFSKFWPLQRASVLWTSRMVLNLYFDSNNGCSFANRGISA